MLSGHTRSSSGSGRWEGCRRAIETAPVVVVAEVVVLMVVVVLIVTVVAAATLG